MLISIGTALAGLVGKSAITAKAAKLIGIVALVVAVGLVLSVGMCVRDKRMIENHENARNAEIANGVLEAERSANANALGRQQEFANSQANVQGSVNNATANDPNAGRTPAGPVTQSAIDGMRRERDRKAGPE